MDYFFIMMAVLMLLTCFVYVWVARRFRYKNVRVVCRCCLLLSFLACLCLQSACPQRSLRYRLSCSFHNITTCAAAYAAASRPR
jgi:hypothetical protein